MKTTRMGFALLACAAVLQTPFASAQPQPPKLPAGTDVLPPPVITKQAPQEAAILKYKDYLAQLPAGASPAAGTTESRQAELALLAAQTDTIKALAKRLDTLEARVQQLEAGKKAGGAK